MKKWMLRVLMCAALVGLFCLPAFATGGASVQTQTEAGYQITAEYNADLCTVKLEDANTGTQIPNGGYITVDQGEEWVVVGIEVSNIADGYRVKSVLIEDGFGPYDMAENIVVNNGYTAGDIAGDTFITVELEPIPATLPEICAIEFFLDGVACADLSNVNLGVYSELCGEVQFSDGSETFARCAYEYSLDGANWLSLPFSMRYFYGEFSEFVPEEEFYLRLHAVGLENYSTGNFYSDVVYISTGNTPDEPDTGDTAVTSGYCGGEGDGTNLTWTLSDDGTLTISGAGAMANYTNSYSPQVGVCSSAPWNALQESIRFITVGDNVTTIGNHAFAYCRSVTGVTLGSSVERIGREAFSQCSGLYWINIPASVTAIGDSAFNACFGLSRVYITDVGAWCGIQFEGELSSPMQNHYNLTRLYLGEKLLQEVIIPNGVTTIPKYAFNYDIDSVTIPASVTHIAARAFDYVDSVHISDLAAWCAIEFDDPDANPLSGGVCDLYLEDERVEDLDIPEGVASIGDWAFYKYYWLKSVTIPAGVTKIGKEAFFGCNVGPSITIPASVDSIGEGALACSALTEIKVSFYNSAYVSRDGVLFTKGSNRLIQYPAEREGEKYTIPMGTTAIEASAFWDCDNLTKVTILNGVTSIGDEAFSNCSSLSRITIPDSVTSVGRGAFFYCAALTSVDIGSGVTSLGGDEFSYCEKLEFIRVAANNPAYSSVGGVLYNKEKTRLIHCPRGKSGVYAIPAGVTRIENSAFAGCDYLSGVIIPDGVTSIGTNAFNGGGKMKSLVIPASVNVIGYGAFAYYGDERFDVTFKGDAPLVESDTQYDQWSTVLHYFPNRSGWSTPVWNGYKTKPILITENGGQSNTDAYYTVPAERSFYFYQDFSKFATEVSMTVDGQTVNSGNSHSLKVKLTGVSEKKVLFEKDGCYAFEVPLRLLNGANTLNFCASSRTTPFVQLAYGSNDGIRYEDMVYGSALQLEAGSLTQTTALYFDVNWCGQTPGKIYLSRSKDISDGIEVQEGYNEEQNITAELRTGGALYLIMKTGNGRQFIQRLNASIIGPGTKLDVDLGDSIEIPKPSTDNLTGGEFLTGFDFGIDLLDTLEVELTIQADGTVKGTIGVEAAKETDTATLVDSIKDALSISESDKNKTDNVKDLIKTIKNGGLGKLKAPKSTKFGVKAECQIVGYLEGKTYLDKGGTLGLELTEIKIGVLFGGGVEASMQLYVAQAPVYVRTEVGVEFGFNVVLIQEETDPVPSLFARPMEFEAKLEAKVGAGLGWDAIASAGVYGKGGFTLEHRIPGTRDDLKLYVNAAFGLEAEFFCFSGDIEVWKMEDFYLYPWNYEPSAALFSVRDIGWQSQSRDYLYAASPMALDGDSAQTGGETVVSMVYPYSNVQQAVLPDGTQILVWTADPGTRQEDNNRTVLYYAYNDGYGWSAPAPVEVEDDGTADFNPVLQVLDGVAYLFWQDASRPLIAADDVTTTAAVMDVSCAVFDAESGAFTGLGAVGSDYYDGAVSATVMDGKPAVIWASNSTNSPLSASGKVSTLYRAVWDGEQWITSVLAEELGAIDQTAANGSSVWFSADTDFDGATLNDREIFLYDGTLTRMTNNEVADTKPVYENSTVLWYSGGSVVTADKKTIPLAEDTDRYQYIISENGMEAVTYVVTDENRVSTLYASFNDGTGWGDPIQLAGGNGNIGSFSAQFLTDGTLSVSVRERSVTLPEDEYDVAQLSAAAQIKTYTVTPVCDLTVEGVDYLAHSLVSGGTLDVMLDVSNAGMTAVELMKVSVLDGEEVLHEGVYEVNLLSGQSDTLFVAVPLPEYIPESMAVQVSAIGYTDATAGDNSAELTLRLQDISLESATATSDGEATQVTVLAVNRGQQDLEDMTLTLTDEAGTALDSKTDLSLAAGESQFITFDLAQAYANNTLLKVTASGPETENIMANNSAAALVSAAPEAKLTLAASYLRTETSLKVVTELDNTTDEGCSYSFYCALYNEDGQQLAVQSLTEQFTAGADNNMVQFTFDGDWSEVAAIKVFALKSGAEPLTGNAQVSVER